jgi:hypothetical protein
VFAASALPQLNSGLYSADRILASVRMLLKSVAMPDRGVITVIPSLSRIRLIVPIPVAWAHEGFESSRRYGEAQPA